MTAHLILDIETIPDPELPRLDDSDRVPPPPMNQIVTLGCLLLEDYVPKKIGVVGEHKNERDMLGDFANWLDRTRPCVVTWNGRGFDMPVITSRALKHGISMPWWFSDRNTRYRYSPEGHMDLMDFLADFGAAKSTRLDIYAKLVGLPGKVGVDGSQVAPMVHAGKLDEVNAYCLCDVAQTAGLFLRVQLLRGAIDRATYVGLAKTMLAFFDADPRLKPVTDNVDRPRFSLDPPSPAPTQATSLVTQTLPPESLDAAPQSSPEAPPQSPPQSLDGGVEQVAGTPPSSVTVE